MSFQTLPAAVDNHAYAPAQLKEKIDGKKVAKFVSLADLRAKQIRLYQTKIRQDSFESYDALSQALAEVIVQQLADKPDSCLGLPTGRTPLGCYKILSDYSKSGRLDWRSVRAFQLDEYMDPFDETMTFASFLESNLLQHTNLPASNRFNPRQQIDYDAEIAKHGGLDLTILGIGNNGHIAFNEPGVLQNSWTHCQWLTESTREANKTYFNGQPTVPKQAVTMGVATILASRKLILVASGESKRDILKRSLFGPVTAEIPASYISLHKNVRVLTDFEL